MGLLLLTFLLPLGVVSCQSEAKHEAGGNQAQQEATTEQDHHTSDGKQAHTVHWSYEGDEGPAHWATLCPEFALCGDGKRQSPIDLSDATVVDSISVRRDYQPTRMSVAHHEHVADIIDNGHTIQITYDEGSTLILPEGEFDLVQFHFHLPSEHTVEGQQYAMEMHLVHQSAGGDLAVVGVLIAQGADNPFFARLVDNLPQQPGQVAHFEDAKVNIDDIMPADSRHYHYDGSLTTPPCLEGVQWFVMVQPIELSADQIAKFRKVINGNYRPVQPRHGREILIETAE
jgi:carbonic anhydrase